MSERTEKQVYMLTPEQHAQIVKILSDASWHIPEGSALDRDAEAAHVGAMDCPVIRLEQN